MSTVFFLSDTHFDHANILNFKEGNGTHVRPMFDNIHHMNQVMIDNWNKVVKPQDKVYHLGDVALGKNLWFMKALNGHKRLIRGNHDGYKLKEYAQYFEEIYGTKHLQGCWLTHAPIHPESLRGKLNIHGHLHGGRVRRSMANGVDVPDEDYFNVSVECINYTPISVDELMQKTGRKLL